jgi:hypothetical protein
MIKLTDWLYGKASDDIFCSQYRQLEADRSRLYTDF